ncbi:hypothetical protein MesoLjLc_49450 [Mesorhizobium sp. L-8-10]|uniref:hypothetical protein n=1 Tax=Mesorhizobium sp. L-8-10 TaxID=2744523 RepID=UPI0019292C73|nr:hypothetical protein [Mesorhizobium sp. L-8-10]BCH33015.1 hypothetical protein MesoLjLc_49450 [Mesorhizobium sp. L-8-10]
MPSTTSYRRARVAQSVVVTDDILAGFDAIGGNGTSINFTHSDRRLRQGIMMRSGFVLEQFIDAPRSGSRHRRNSCNVRNKDHLDEMVGLTRSIPADLPSSRSDISRQGEIPQRGVSALMGLIPKSGLNKEPFLASGTTRM